MELKKEFLKGGTVYHEVVGHVTIVNDEKEFAKYKKLGLDVFKVEKKKKVKKDED
tara:strand:- start:65 stop:229 length:165 start_codon:yes stop_codon:yes gene_type:complete